MIIVKLITLQVCFNTDITTGDHNTYFPIREMTLWVLFKRISASNMEVAHDTGIFVSAYFLN